MRLDYNLHAIKIFRCFMRTYFVLGFPLNQWASSLIDILPYVKLSGRHILQNIDMENLNTYEDGREILTEY